MTFGDPRREFRGRLLSRRGRNAVARGLGFTILAGFSQTMVKLFHETCLAFYFNDVNALAKNHIHLVFANRDTGCILEVSLLVRQQPCIELVDTDFGLYPVIMPLVGFEVGFEILLCCGHRDVG